MTRTVAVLFARSDSIYKSIPRCDVYDIDRDARKWSRVTQSLRTRRAAHGADCASLQNLVTTKKLAVWSIAQIRKWGGVLEHPAYSTLWAHCGLPTGLVRDAYGGCTLRINQRWFGNRCEKSTWLYVCGCDSNALPTFEIDMTPPTHCIDRSSRHPNSLPRVPHPEREKTPERLAHWLVEVARKCM